LSFDTKEAHYFEKLIINHNYIDIKKFFIKHNIKYIINYPNLSKDFLNSYLFDKKILNSLDDDLKKNIF
jgi:hypothetical protein